MTNKTKGRVVEGLGLCLDIVPALAATATQFPIWVERSAGATVSGLFVLFAMLSAIPLRNKIKEYMKSPSVVVLWCVGLVIALALRNIIDQMVVVCFVGLVSNIAGSGVYSLGKAISSKEDKIIPEEE